MSISRENLRNLKPVTGEDDEKLIKKAKREYGRKYYVEHNKDVFEEIVERCSKA